MIYAQNLPPRETEVQVHDNWMLGDGPQDHDGYVMIL